MSLNMNRGAEQLSRAGSISDLAAQLNVNTRTISGWRSGAKSPNDASRANLERVVGIARRSWDMRVLPKPAALPARHAQERRLDIPERCPWLTYGHPLASLTVRRLALTDAGAADEEQEALEAEREALRVRHPELVAACEAAELALGLALAAEATDDECAVKFLRFHGREGQANAAA